MQQGYGVMIDTINMVKEPETFDPQAKETVLVSLCAFGVHCRYHGKSHKMGHLLYKEKPTEKLRKKYNILPVCGEIMGGLLIPREPCDVIESPEGLRVVGRIDSKDYTAQYNKGAEEALRLANIFNVKKAYLLKDSPMYGKGYGILARLLEENGIQVNHI